MATGQEQERHERFQFTGNLSRASLTDENIREISDGLARQIAAEAAAAPGDVDVAFHIRLGGEHSRIFSRGPDHKNTIHSNVIIAGGGGLGGGG
jgi:hypothetical protein